MRIAFAGTPVFAQVQLEALFNSPHEIVVIYTQPDRASGRGQHLQYSPVKTLGLKHLIPIEQPHSLKTHDAVKTLKQYAPDIMVVAAYGLILPLEILQTPKYGCINVHASLLPRWRGASPIQQAILAGDKQTGITLMQMDVGLDSGNILTQQACEIKAQDTAGSLHDTLAALGGNSLISYLNHPNHFTLTPTQHGLPQDSKNITYAHKISKEQALISWTFPALAIERAIRAYNPWPVAYTVLGSQIIRIWQAKVLNKTFAASCGTIVEHHPEGIVVATGDQALLLTEGQLPGKKRLPFSEILKSRQSFFAVGQVFHDQNDSKNF